MKGSKIPWNHSKIYKISRKQPLNHHKKSPSNHNEIVVKSSSTHGFLMVFPWNHGKPKKEPRPMSSLLQGASNCSNITCRRWRLRAIRKPTIAETLKGHIYIYIQIIYIYTYVYNLYIYIIIIIYIYIYILAQYVYIYI